MEVAGLEEADAAALAQVAQQVELLVLEEVGVAVVERLQILDELALALVQRRRADLDDVRVQIQQRLVQVPAEPDGLHALELPRLEVALLDRGLQLLELGDDLLLRLVDQDAVVAIVR